MAKTWQANDKQKKVMEILANADHPLTLNEISAIYGENIATGSINTLLTKGLMVHGEDAEVEVVVKKKVATYKLAD